MIRTTTFLAPLLVVAACAPTAPSSGAWQKAGASEPTIAADNAQCRDLAQQAAVREYPYGAVNPMLGGMVAAHQKADRDRASTEIARFNDCMQARGYTR